MNKRDKIFFENYLRDNVFDKVVMLRELIESEDFLSSYQKSLTSRGKNSITNLDSYKDSLKLEIHFKLFNALENLFALMLGIIESPDDVWEWMTTYSNQEFNKKIKKISKIGLERILEDSNRNLLVEVFFPNVPSEALSLPQIKGSVETIPEIVKKCASEFLSKKDEYNAFKHGGRILKVNIKGDIARKDSVNWTKESMGISFLKNDGSLEVRPFDYKRDFKIIEVTWALIRLIIDQRKIKDKEMKMFDFSKLDFIGIFKEEFPFKIVLDNDWRVLE